MRLRAEEDVEVIDEDGEINHYIIAVDEDADVVITAPCGEEVSFTAGRKGKFFRDMLKAYEKIAKAIGVYDTEKENKPYGYYAGLEEEENEE